MVKKMAMAVMIAMLMPCVMVSAQDLSWAPSWGQMQAPQGSSINGFINAFDNASMSGIMPNQTATNDYVYAMGLQAYNNARAANQSPAQATAAANDAFHQALQTVQNLAVTNTGQASDSITNSITQMEASLAGVGAAGLVHPVAGLVMAGAAGGIIANAGRNLAQAGGQLLSVNSYDGSALPMIPGSYAYSGPANGGNSAIDSAGYVNPVGFNPGNSGYSVGTNGSVVNLTNGQTVMDTNGNLVAGTSATTGTSGTTQTNNTTNTLAPNVATTNLTNTTTTNTSQTNTAQVATTTNSTTSATTTQPPAPQLTPGNSYVWSKRYDKKDGDIPFSSQQVAGALQQQYGPGGATPNPYRLNNGLGNLGLPTQPIAPPAIQHLPPPVPPTLPPNFMQNFKKNVHAGY